MAEVLNLAAKYSKKVDERFTQESQAMMALNSDYDFDGVRTVNIYSIPTSPMHDYNRSGSNRYGEPEELGRNIQTESVTQDRSFSFTIDKGNKKQSQMVMDAGKALGRQIKEVWVPEFDAYVFRKLAAAAKANGNYSDTELTKSTAYAAILTAMEYMGDVGAAENLVCFCSWNFYNLILQDPNFVKTADSSQEMLKKGVVGTVDGLKLVKVPSARLPYGTNFLIVNKKSACGVRQLQEYRTHTDPPGISGWLVEGRVIHDCFVLDEKVDGIYWQGGQKKVLRRLKVTVSDLADGDGNVKILVNPGVPETGNKFMYKLGAAPEVVTNTTNVTSWTPLTASGLQVAAASNKFVTVVECPAAGTTCQGVGSAKIKRNI